MTAPDLTIIHVLHRGMRVDSARLHAAIVDLDRADRGRLDAVRRWYVGFRAELISHHEVEDTILFPAMAERIPGFAACVSRLDGDHHRLDEVLTEIGVALRELATPVNGWVAAQRRTAVAAADLHALLRTHLAFEDDEVLPLYEQHFTAEDAKEFDDEAKQHLELRDLPFVVSWAMANATDEERMHLLGDAPLLFKVVWWASRRRYARLAERALGSPVDVPMARAA